MALLVNSRHPCRFISLWRGEKDVGGWHRQISISRSQSHNRSVLRGAVDFARKQHFWL